jgi:hypothetical protein
MLPDKLKENLVATYSTHWMKEVHITLICLLLFALGWAAIGMAFGVRGFSISFANASFLLGTVLLLVSYHRFFHMFLSNQLYDILVTDQRVVYYDDSILGYDDEHEIFLEKVAKVHVQHDGALQKLFGYGTLWFEAPEGFIALKRSIPFVPHPQEVKSTIRL